MSCIERISCLKRRLCEQLLLAVQIVSTISSLEKRQVDWLLWNKVAAISKDFWKTIDTVVMGRRTFEFGQKWVQGLPTPKVCLSRTIRKV
jgi:dihydrofolate reductase